ncbi:hypothetical protein RYA05_05920 [Pseudomonas syringae pv. actinidiae]|nr:hypothetical protein [Pseudomonas syringae pv. actinidiae]
MALKPIEDVQVKAIEGTVKALKAANLPHEQISLAVAAQIAAFEGSTRYRLKLHEDALEDGSYLTVIDTKADFVRARPAGEDAQALRAKVFGVPVTIRVADAKTAFTNAQVADALRELADLVAALPKEAKDAGKFDFNGKAEAPGEEEGPGDDAPAAPVDSPDDLDLPEQEEEEEEPVVL